MPSENQYVMADAKAAAYKIIPGPSNMRGGVVPHATSVDSHGLLHEIQYRMKTPLRIVEDEVARLYCSMSVEFVIKSPPCQADQRGHDTPADGYWKTWAA